MDSTHDDAETQSADGTDSVSAAEEVVVEAPKPVKARKQKKKKVDSDDESEPPKAKRPKKWDLEASAMVAEDKAPKKPDRPELNIKWVWNNEYNTVTEYGSNGEKFKVDAETGALISTAVLCTVENPTTDHLRYKKLEKGDSAIRDYKTFMEKFGYEKKPGSKTKKLTSDHADYLPIAAKFQIYNKIWKNKVDQWKVVYKKMADKVAAERLEARQKTIKFNQEQEAKVAAFKAAKVELQLASMKSGFAVQGGDAKRMRQGDTVNSFQVFALRSAITSDIDARFAQFTKDAGLEQS
jgi:virulence-associated protein VapD